MYREVSEKGLSGFSQNDTFREHSRRKRQHSKQGIWVEPNCREVLVLTPSKVTYLNIYSKVYERLPPRERAVADAVGVSHQFVRRQALGALCGGLLAWDTPTILMLGLGSHTQNAIDVLVHPLQALGTVGAARPDRGETHAETMQKPCRHVVDTVQTPCRNQANMHNSCRSHA